MFKLPRLFGRTEKYPKKFLGVDIGAQQARVAYFELGQDDVLVLSAASADTLGQAVESLREDFEDLPKDAVVAVSGPYTKAFTTSVRTSSGKPEEEIVEHARELALREAKDELREFWGEDLQVEELEAEVLEVTEGERLELFLFTSFATSRYLEGLKEKASSAGLNIFSFSSLPFNLSTALDSSQDLNAFIVNVGGRETEVSLIFGGEVMDAKSFIFEFDELDRNPPLFLEFFLNSLETVLSQFSPLAQSFPKEIILTGYGAGVSDFEMQMSSFPWSRRLPFEQEVEVKTLRREMLSKIRAEGTSFEEAVQTPVLSLGHVGLRFKEQADE